VTPQVFGTLGANGWYTTNVTVNWSVVDPESVILSTSGCDAVTLTAETSGTKLTCSASSDGGDSTVSKTIKIDKTAPSATATPARVPDAGGWYNHAVAVSFTGGDGMSGVDSCVAPKTYAGPDTGNASVGGTCSDKAGNVGAASLGLKYDATAPQVTGSGAGRAADSNGWYNHAVAVSFTGSDTTSGIDTCSQPTYAGPDTAAASVAGTCVDKAGNVSGSSTFTLNYDATGPSVSATPGRAADANGWYNHQLAVSFSGSDAVSGLDSCVAPQSYSGPDAGAVSVTGTCRDQAGNTTARSFGLKYDATAPSVTATPGRATDSNGWYNHALTVSFTGSDGTSGLDKCAAPQTYSGPDGNASVNGNCQDKAGNLTPVSLPLKYDATGPNVTAAPARGPGANGWYNQQVAVSFTGVDATSGLDSCVAPQTFSGPDSGAASVSGTCRDQAGNTTAKSFGLKYDATPPVVTAKAGRGPDANGWFNHGVAVSFQGSDALSGLVSCDGPVNYVGPDSAAAAVSGTCVDEAGNLGVGSLSLKYDATGPEVAATPARGPDANGWYNHPVSVLFGGSDTTSGLDSCAGPKTYSGPDDSSGAVGGSCSDKAGNTTVRSLGLRYDATAPQATGASPGRAPDANGWYNHPLTVGFDGTDVTSGIDSCTEPAYSGPDAAAASLSGSCTDTAGNTSGTRAFTFKYDATAPAVTNAVPVRPPDHNGWYTHAVAFAFQGKDATAGIDSCSPETYEGPDGSGALVTGTCLDQAGNTGNGSFGLEYDATGPDVTAAPERNPDANGWYNHPLSVSFRGSDGASGIDYCVLPKSYGGPDSASTTVAGFCVDGAGNVGFGSVPVKYDATAPAVAGGSPARAPDANGWYNHPVAVDFRGSDETSHIESCTSATYSGPDNPAAALRGTCRDQAGNGSNVFDYGLEYDATAPELTSVGVTAGDGMVVIRWQASPDTRRVEVTRLAGKSVTAVAVYQGTGDSFTDKRLKNGVHYRYAIRGFDAAGNAATRQVVATPRAPLFAPLAGATVSAPPLLAWIPVPKARYYNVQVWRNRKIFSAWPTRTRLRLKRSWAYRGHRYRLTPGRYRWYVWPGRGPRSANRYGPLLGSSSFVVAGR
jgi:large repetitive protein